MSPDSLPTVRSYDVDLDLDFDSGAYTGNVQVTLGEKVRSFPLNVDKLEVRSRDPQVRLTPRPDDEEVLLEFPEPTESFRVEFTGRVAEHSLMGLYWSRYGDSRIATSQCEATGARQIFPCLDRPDRRAVIRLTVTTKEGLEAIFNTPVVAQRVDGGRTTFEFEPTPSMATYLFYLAIGEFDWLPKVGRHERVRIAAPPGRADQGAYSLQHAAEILSALESYFGIPYPLPKLDLIAVPEFAFGACENWGAIAYRDMRLLVDRETGARQKRETLTTNAHEIAHQWFGNLVTMSWWTDIWLNESFATFMEEKIVGRLYPTLGMGDDFQLDLAAWARLGDALDSTHPIYVPVKHPDELGQIFDEISYGKGASVLRMMEALLGEETMRAGVTAYLKRYAFGNAASEDLWAALETVSGQPVQKLMGEWVRRPGFPLLEARSDGGRVEVRQRRFRTDGTHVAETWPVPLGVYRDGVVERRLFEGVATTVPRNGARVVHLNPGGIGFYRVHYDATLLDELLEGFPTLSALDRWSVLNDLYSFVMSGDGTLADWLRFVAASKDAKEYLVVHEIASELSANRHTRIMPLGAIVQGTPAYRRDGLAFLRAQVERLGLAKVDGEPASDGVLRERTVLDLVPFDDALARTLAAKFDEYERIDPDLREAVAYAYARRGGGPELDRLFERINAAKNEGDQLKLERALGAFPDPGVLRRALSVIGTPNFNRAHISAVVNGLALNPAARAPLWEWLTVRLPELAPSYRGTGLVAELLERSVPFAALDLGEEKARAAFAAHPIPEGDRGLRKGLEWLRVFTALRERLSTGA